MTSLVGYLLLFTVTGILFLLVTLLIGKLVRPSRPNPEKAAIYECGEPTIGSSWIQFDLRFYVVALLFIIFDVEVAFFFPWATVFGKVNHLARSSSAQLRQEIGWGSEAASTSGQAASPGRSAAHSEVVALLTAGVSADTPSAVATVRSRAHRLAVLAFVDILVFFGVLLVGFAYVWKRGDIDWVRAIRREPTSAPTEEQAPEPVEVG